MDLKKINLWLLSIFIVIYMVTGYGITQFRIVEPLTMGMLTKTLSFKIHDILGVPFIAVLVIHVYFNLRKKDKRKTG